MDGVKTMITDGDKTTMIMDWELTIIMVVGVKLMITDGVIIRMIMVWEITTIIMDGEITEWVIKDTITTHMIQINLAMAFNG